MMQKFINAYEDIKDSFRKGEYIWVVIVHNLKQTYTRTKLGLFWIPLNKIIFGVCLGGLYGALFQQDIKTYLPYVLIGIISWQFIAASISTGMRTFTNYAGILKYFGFPKFVFLLQVQLQNLLEYLLLIPVVVVTALIVAQPSLVNLVYFFFGLLIVVINVFWVASLLSIFTLYFRDVEQLVDTAMRLLFLVTPIIWKVETLQGRAAFLELNPFYHLVQFIRAPILSEEVDLNVYIAFLLIGLFGNILFFLVFSFFRSKLVYKI